MTDALCLFHDHVRGREPRWVLELSGLCRMVTVHRRDWMRLGQFVDLPWLVDVRLDREAVTILKPFFSFAGPAPRVIAARGGDRLSLVQADALGATTVLRHPIEVGSVLGLVGACGERGDAGQYGDRDTKIAATIEACHPAVPAIDAVPTRRTTGEAQTRVAVGKAAVVLDRLFDALRIGRQIVREDWEGIVSDIVPEMSGDHLAMWLDIVRRHHFGTYQHSLLVMAIAADLGRSLGCSIVEIERLALGGLLHDVGKFRVPLAILDKPGRLAPAEFEVVRRHPRDGGVALRSIEPDLDPSVVDLVLHHHEQLDGSGYPDGLTASEITPLVRVLSIADVYGALIERRSYRAPLRPLDARAIVAAMAEDGKLDRRLIGGLVDLRVECDPESSIDSHSSQRLEMKR